MKPVAVSAGHAPRFAGLACGEALGVGRSMGALRRPFFSLSLVYCLRTRTVSAAYSTSPTSALFRTRKRHC
jgi:hypothetical protein